MGKGAPVKASFGRMSAQATSSRPGKQPAGGPIRSGNLVFVGGIGGWYPERRPDGPGDAREQFGDALEMMKASLEKAGTSMANVLRIKVSLVDPLRNWNGVADVFRDRFPDRIQYRCEQHHGASW